ncbi:hypothetical protein ACIP69_07975 [Streptomyces hygroscopicus]|uniref:hypothetical protein n=1 Tax=Streptomyces hygroscopicus TaxID=1912 RepID=UPI003810EDC0
MPHRCHIAKGSWADLRGWAFDKTWCDEYAAWSRHPAQEVYDMLWFCLREADAPQVMVSTTPKPLPHSSARAAADRFASFSRMCPRVFAELEEQMTTFVGQGETEDSPDLLDSAVWALWDLFLDPTMPSPRGGDDQRLSGRRQRRSSDWLWAAEE